MYLLFWVNVYCHRVTTQLRLTNIYHIISYAWSTVSGDINFATETFRDTQGVYTYSWRTAAGSGSTHTHRMRCCVFTAIAITLPLHSVTLYVHCLSCFNANILSALVFYHYFWTCQSNKYFRNVCVRACVPCVMLPLLPVTLEPSYGRGWEGGGLCEVRNEAEEAVHVDSVCSVWATVLRLKKQLTVKM
jgi:hypothetical protein